MKTPSKRFGKGARLLAVVIVMYAGTTGTAMLLLNASTPCASLLSLQLHGIREAGVAISEEEAERYRREPILGFSRNGVETISAKVICALSWWYPLFQDDDEHRATWRSYQAHAPPFRGS